MRNLTKLMRTILIALLMTLATQAEKAIKALDLDSCGEE